MEKKTAEAYDAALYYVKHNLLPEFRPNHAVDYCYS